MPDKTDPLLRQINRGFNTVFDYEMRSALWPAFKIMFVGIAGIILSIKLGDIKLGEQVLPSFAWLYLAIAFQAGIIASRLGLFK